MLALLEAIWKLVPAANLAVFRLAVSQPKIILKVATAMPAVILEPVSVRRTPQNFRSKVIFKLQRAFVIWSTVLIIKGC